MLFCCGVQRAHADLVFVLTPTSVTAALGQTVEFSGQLTNTGTDSLYLNTDFGIVDGPLTLDDSPFFNTWVLPNPQLTLPADNIAHTSELFTVSLPSDPTLYAGLGPTFAGGFTLYGGATAGDTTELGTQAFTITLAGNTVPETGTVGMCVALLTAGGLLRRSRRASGG
jgi:hypothetical protein